MPHFDDSQNFSGKLSPLIFDLDTGMRRTKNLMGSADYSQGCIQLPTDYATAVNASNQAAGPWAVANMHFFPGFQQQFICTSGATINTLVGGSGPPLLLLHGHPETPRDPCRLA